MTAKESNEQTDQVQSEVEDVKQNTDKESTESNPESKAQPANDVDALIEEQPDYLFPSGEIDCKKSLFKLPHS